MENENRNDCVSIIVPVYNVEKYIERCIDSLLTQTYTSLEIILVDDGSTDSSGMICDCYNRLDERIKVYHKKNEGLGLTRNYGMVRAKGTYLTFVDSDDFLEKNSIEVLMKKAYETDADIVVGTHFCDKERYPIFLPERLYKGNEIRDILMVYLMGNSARQVDSLSCTSCGKLYKRSLLHESGVLFPSEREYIWEDLVFVTNLFSYCEKIYISHFPVYHYCYNEASLTHSYRRERLEMVMKLYDYMKKLVKQFGLPEEAYRRLDTNFIGHIRTCLKQEVFYAKSEGRRQAFTHICAICSYPQVQTLIRAYPKSDFNIAQRVLNYCMEKQWNLCVFGLCWLQNKKKRI